jgi:alpha/beta hydrolase fold
MLVHFKSCAVMLPLLVLLFSCATKEWEPEEISASPGSFNEMPPFRDQWKLEEMSSRRGSFIEIPLLPGRQICGVGLAWCEFKLHYFNARQQETRSREKYVLYIPGGPGEVIDRAKQHPLEFITSHDVRIVYFDIRGAGYSLIPIHNTYDQFLRAKYVMEDIEELRRKIFNECLPEEAPIETNCERKHRPWDAIYAHSWGTIVAQMYAEKYKHNVQKLILSAPISRVNLDKGAARREMIVKNLVSVFRSHKVGKCPWPPVPNQELFYRNTFCFLTDSDIDLMAGKLKSLLNGMEREYGSTNFINSHYGEVIKDAQFRMNYPYPEAFYDALQLLEGYGAGEKEGFRFETQVRDAKLDAALFVAYFLMLKDVPDPVDPDGKNTLFICRRRAELLELIGDVNVQNEFCKRLNGWWKNLGLHAPNDNSRRANVVYGIYDGLERSIHRLLEDRGQTNNSGCYSTQVLHDVARGHVLPDKKAVQKVVKKIGVPGMFGEDKICRWDPGKHPHEVDTLIVAGDADPTTAGGQARHFYYHGLTKTKRAMIELPGVGHLMAPQVKTDEENEIRQTITENFGGTIEIFITDSSNISEFINNEKVRTKLEVLGTKPIYD